MAAVDVGAALEAVCIWVKSNQLGFKYDLAVMSKETPELNLQLCRSSLFDAAAHIKVVWRQRSDLDFFQILLLVLFRSSDPYGSRSPCGNQWEHKHVLVLPNLSM